MSNKDDVWGEFMKLSIRNIGKVRSADIDINGITIIAGENDTGKSTIGKTLYSIFSSLYDVEATLESLKHTQLCAYLRIDYSSEYARKASSIADVLLQDLTYKDDIARFSTLLDSVVTIKTVANHDKLFTQYVQLCDLTIDSFIRKQIENKLCITFNDQVNNFKVLDEGVIELTIKDNKQSFVVRDNEIASLENIGNLYQEAIYYDNPHVLDELNETLRFRSARLINVFSKRTRLLELLMQETPCTDKPLDNLLLAGSYQPILDLLEDTTPGNLTFSNGIFRYTENGDSTTLNVKNLSTGLKTFVVLKTLVKKGCLKENGTIIFDEPEIHLHPKWQLRLAEVIVLLKTELNMHILLTTHSPYFIEAIQTYTQKYNVDKDTKFYLAQNTPEGSVISDVTDSVENIYDLLAEPFQTMEDIRCADD